MRIVVETGRLRRLAWMLYLAVAVLGGWVWFGNAGAALLGLWVTSWKPGREIVVTLPDRVRRIKLSRFAVTVYWGAKAHVSIGGSCPTRSLRGFDAN